MGVIVCDLDGTLLDIRRRDHEAYLMAAASVGVDPLGISEYWARRRSGLRIVDLISEDGDERAAQTALKVFVEAVESDDLLDLDTLVGDAASFSQGCVSAGWRTVVCTLRRRPDAALAQVERLGLADLVDSVHVVPHGGPTPKASILAMHAPEQTLMLGDTESDIASARAAGVAALAVTTGLRDRAYLSRLGPDMILDSLTELLPQLRGLS